MAASVSVTLEGNIAQVTFDNPPLNYATVGLLTLIADALEALDKNPDVRAIVLCTQDKLFCAGANLAADNGFEAATDDPLREFYDHALRIYACRKPIVAAVRGAAIGAGLGLAVACDFRVAGPNARFSANFVKLGFHPGFGLTYTLPRAIGHQHASEMFMTADRYKPEQVQPWGLVDRVSKCGQVVAYAKQLAREIAENAPLALLSTRATLRAGLVENVAAAILIEHREQTALEPTDDFAEGIKATAERRPGKFTGR